jgi:hypothetical protein
MFNKLLCRYRKHQHWLQGALYCVLSHVLLRLGAANATLTGAVPEVESHKVSDSGWYPFDTKKGKSLLADLDLAFLGSYACELGAGLHLKAS